MPVKFAASKREKRDEYLDMCVFAYNTSRHESTCFTPFELMFGRKPILTIDIEMRKDTAEDCLERVMDTSDLPPSEVERMAAERLQ